MESQTKRQRVSMLASSLFSCKNDECRQVSGATTKTSKDGLYRVNVQCISCNQSWVVCIACQRRFNGTKVYLANRHFDEAHSTNSPILSKVSTNASSVAFSSESNFEESDSNVIIKQCLRESSMEVKSRSFFKTRQFRYHMLYKIWLLKHFLNLQHLQCYPIYLKPHSTYDWPTY